MSRGRPARRRGLSLPSDRPPAAPGWPLRRGPGQRLRAAPFHRFLYRRWGPPARMAAKEAASGAKKPAFGGYTISFAGRKETAEEIFGKDPIAPSEMTKKIWSYVKSNGLSSK